MAKRPVRKKVVKADLPDIEEINETIKEVVTGESEKHAGGRPPLKIKRVPLTTSLTEQNKMNLGILASMKGIRLADVLNDILEEYFKNNSLR